MKRPWMERFGDFMAGKGFYIVLFLCVAAIGISGYYLFSSLAGNQDAATVAASAQVIVTPAPPHTVTPVKPSAPATASPKPVATPTPTPTAAPTPTPTPKPVATSTVYTWPVKGELLRSFSVETLAYDATMGDYRTHDGLDIAAELGTQVKAAAGGTVASIRQDDLLGTTVTIDHGNGLKSVYSNLAGEPTVREGDTVTTGAVIGSVGDTAIKESGLPTHLHLAMYQGDAAVNPTDYLPEVY